MRRVVVTGTGVIAPKSNSAGEFFENLLAGKSTAVPVSSFDAGDNKCRIACEASTFDPLSRLDKKAIKRTSRFIQMAICAAWEAVEQSGIKIDDDNSIATFIGTGAGGFDFIDDGYGKFAKRGPASASPFAITNIIPNMAASNVAIEFGLHGPCSAPVAACASGLYAISDAFDYIRYGRGDIALCGGSESTMTSFVMSGYEAIRVLSLNNDSPQEASRPFDSSRDGFVMGEGAGILVLESYDSAAARGAEILCEVTSCATSCDASHITSPDPEAVFIKNTISNALKDSGISPQDLAFVSAHGTSTRMNDTIEAKAISETLGVDVPVTSIKSMIGHTLGASGALAAIAAMGSLKTGQITPSLNFQEQDSDTKKINIVNEPTATGGKKHALINAFGFGGHNACVVLKSF